jgi:small subunit ribosomal protein S17
VRIKQDKTAVVEMVWKQRHRLYHKQVRRVARFYVHDPENQCRLGDLVRIEETRPISKTKHWRLLEIIERRQVAEVRPIELEGDAATAVAEPEIEDTLLELDEDIDPDILDQLTAGNGEFEDGEDD